VPDASDRDSYPNLAAGAAAGAGVLAAVAALATRGAPRWARVTLVLGVLVIAGGIGAYAYRLMSQPTTLTVAAGSFDGDAPKLMTAVASKLNAANTSVRLKVVEKMTAAEAAAALAKGETDLAVIRPDNGDFASARALMVVAHAAVLIIAPPGSGVTSMDDLKGKTIGVIGGQINQTVTAIIAREYEFEKNKTRFRYLLPVEAAPAVNLKQVQALLVVTPLSERYIARVREILARGPKGKVTLVPIESAGAIASLNKAFDSYDLPKGIIRGSPPVPDDDVTTLRMPLYLVANRKISDEAAGALVKAVFDARRELISEYPLLAQIAQPDKDKDAFIPIHPGAAAYFEGEQKSFFDKHGDQLFYGSMLFGSLASLLAAAWRFMVRSDRVLVERPLTRLFALMDEVRNAREEAELVHAEEAIDEILRVQLEGAPPGEIDAGEAAAVSLATHRLERMLSQKRAAFTVAAAAPPVRIRQV
jgi:TRAP transporter TAXI family solute receptor